MFGMASNPIRTKRTCAAKHTLQLPSGQQTGTVDGGRAPKASATTGRDSAARHRVG